jgi:hypothetical protein
MENFMSAFQFMEVAADCAAVRKVDCVFARDEMGEWRAIIRLKDGKGAFEATFGEVNNEKKIDDGVDAKGKKKTKSVKLSDDEYFDAVRKVLTTACARAREARIKAGTNISPMIRAA